VAKNILQHWKLADLDSQYVRKLEGHLNRKGGKIANSTDHFKSDRIWSFFIAIIP
jgi:hypothetical protein